MKKYFLSLLTFIASFALFFDSASAITMLTHPHGTGSNVVFNQYEDSINLIENRGYGVSLDEFSSCVDLPPSLEQDLQVPYPAGVIQSGQYAGTPYPAGISTVEWEDLYKNGYPFFGKTCLTNRYNAVRTDPGLNASSYSSLMNENNFAVGRVLSSQPGGIFEPTLDTNTTSNFTPSSLEYFVKNGAACNNSTNLLMNYTGTSPNGICDVRPKLPTYSTIPQYSDNLQNIGMLGGIGDRIRIYSYLHNNASEHVYNITLAQFNALDDDGNGFLNLDLNNDGLYETSYNYAQYLAYSNQQYLNNLATNTTVTFDWSVTGVISVTIDSDQTAPITNTVTYTTAPIMGIQPSTQGLPGNNAFYISRRNSSETSQVNVITGATSITVPMGAVASSFGNVQELFVDFEVVLDSPINVEKTAALINGTDLPDGTNITAVHGLGAGDIYEYTVAVTNTDLINPTPPITITDFLDPNITFVGTTDTGVLFNGTNNVTMDFGVIPPGVTASKSFLVQIQPLPAGTTSIVNTAGGFGSSGTITLIVEDVQGPFDVTMVKQAEDLLGVVIPNGANLTPGQTYRYRITVTNNETFVLDPFTLTDVLDANLDYIGALGDLDITAVLGAIDVVTLDFAPLAPGVTDTKVFEVQVMAGTPDGTIILNQATANDGSVTNETNHIVDDIVVNSDFVKQAEDQLGVVIPNGSTLALGQIYRYRITATNSGTTAINPLIFTDILDPNLTYVGNLGDPTITEVGGVVTLDFGSLAAGATDTKIFEVQVNAATPAGTIILNQAIANDGTGTNVTDHIIEGNPNLDIVKQAEDQLGVVIPNGSTLTPGQIYRYQIMVSNGGANAINPLILTDTLDANLTYVGNLGDPTITEIGGVVTLNFGNLPPLSANIKTFEVQVNAATPDGTVILNQAIASDGTGSNITDHIVDTGIINPNLVLTKSAEDITGTLIPDGSGLTAAQVFRYRIRAENTGTATLAPFVLTDTLDANLTYIDSVPTGDPNISEVGGVVTLTFGAIAPGAANAIELVFEVQLNAGVANGTVINNVATDGTNTTNTTTHIVGGNNNGNPNGGGGAPTVDTGGVCHKFPNSDTYECRKVYPEWNLSDPDYLAYEACIDSISEDGIKTEEQCLADWIASKEFTPCTLAENFSGNQLGQNPELIAHQECGLPEVIPACEPLTAVNDSNIVVSKNIVGKEVVALEDDITYEVTVNVNTGDSATLFTNSGQEGVIETATIQVYDFVVPSKSGWLSSRELTSSDDEWEWTGTYFEKDFTSNEIQQLNTGGLIDSFQYTMKAGLVANENVCQIKNVAFATVDFNLKQQYQDAAGNSVIVEFDKELRSSLGGESSSCAAVNLQDLHSLGDAATAELQIIRPFLQTRGGSNLAIQSDKLITGNSSEIVDSNASSSEEFTDGDLNDSLSKSTVFRDNYFNLLENNVSESVTRFNGLFTGTEDNAGVWFLSGNQSFTVPASFDLGRSETFIIENGDLIINQDILMTGSSRDYIPAFIVKNGDIKIAPNVKKIEGIFIALNGSILSGDGGDVSEDQLIVSGSLVGDAFDLLYNRRYIGSFENGVLTNGLEPSVKITYDLRLVENTPPALENFLGKNWQQKVD